MGSRRDFIKGTLVLAGVAAVASARAARADTCPAGLIYTQTAPGRWSGKETLHSPQVTVDGSKVTVVTPHPMSPSHYIVKHTLLDATGKVLGERTFANTETEAKSVYQLPDGFHGDLCAASFCNLHDLWIAQFTV